MKFKKITKATALALGVLLTTNIATPYVHAYPLSSIQTTDYDNLDRPSHPDTIDLSELRRVILEAGLEEINKHRSRMDLPPLEPGHNEVQAITYKHARYTAIEDDRSHTQSNSHSPYFVGYSVLDRFESIGLGWDKISTYGENLNFPSTFETELLVKYLLHKDYYDEEHFRTFIKDEVRELIDAPYHGAILLSPNYQYANIDLYADPNTRFATLAVKLYSDKDYLTFNGDIELTKPRFYPYDRQKDVVTHMTRGMENPDPINEAGLQVGGKPLIAYSYAIPIPNTNNSFDYAVAEEAELINKSSGKTIRTKRVTQSKANRGTYSIFVPVEKLEPHTEYEAIFTYLEPQYSRETSGDSASIRTVEQVKHKISFSTGEERTEANDLIVTLPYEYKFRGKTYNFLETTIPSSNKNNQNRDGQNNQHNDGKNNRDNGQKPGVNKPKYPSHIIPTTSKVELNQVRTSIKVTYTDYREGEYWSEPILWLNANNIMLGSLTYDQSKTGAQTRVLKPYSNLTELQMLALLFRYVAPEKVVSDTAYEDWGTPYYQLAKELNLPLNGDLGKNRVKGDQPITREHMAVILAQTLTGKTMTSRQAIQFLYDNNISTGVPQTVNGKTIYPKTYESFNPQGYLTRGQTATFFYRIQQQIEQGSLEFDNTFFTDKDSSSTSF